MLCLLTAIISVFYARARLQIEAGQANVAGTAGRDQRNYLAYKQEFPDRRTLVVVIDRHNRERAEQLADRLAANLRRDSHDVAGVFYRSDTACRSLGHQLPR